MNKITKKKKKKNLALFCIIIYFYFVFFQAILSVLIEISTWGKANLVPVKIRTIPLTLEQKKASVMKAKA